MKKYKFSRKFPQNLCVSNIDATELPQKALAGIRAKAEWRKCVSSAPLSFISDAVRQTRVLAPSMGYYGPPGLPLVVLAAGGGGAAVAPGGNGEKYAMTMVSCSMRTGMGFASPQDSSFTIQPAKK